MHLTARSKGAIAACGAPLVGILAERVFGFKVQLEMIPSCSLHVIFCAASFLVCTTAKHHHHHCPDADMLPILTLHCALEPLIPGWYQVPGGLRVSACCRARAEIDPADVDKNLGKARALGNALLCCMAIPWALCVIIYSGTLFTPLLGAHSVVNHLLKIFRKPSWSHHGQQLST